MRSEYPASAALGHTIVDCWNNRDLDRLFDSFHPSVEYTSPRVVDAHAVTEGTVGSENGIIRGTDALRDFLIHSMRAAPKVRLALLHVARGLDGAVAVTYAGSDGTVATEVLRLDQGRVVRVEVMYGVPTD